MHPVRSGVLGVGHPPLALLLSISFVYLKTSLITAEIELRYIVPKYLRHSICRHRVKYVLVCVSTAKFGLHYGRKTWKFQ